MKLTDIGLFGHLLAFLGFSGLAVSALWRDTASAAARWMSFAAAVTALWALTFVLTVFDPARFAFWLTAAGTLRSAGWIGFLVAMLRPTWQRDSRLRFNFVFAGVMGGIVSLQLALDLFGGTFLVLVGESSPIAPLFNILRMTVAVAGLVLVQNMFVNAEDDGRDAVRLLAIAMSGMFIYDLNFHTLAYLVPPPSSDLYNIRGTVFALLVPLLLIASREGWAARMQVSRQVMFHTLSFSVIGMYLIAMALLAYGLRLFGGDWGRLFQVTFLFGTIVLGAIILFSPRFRAALRLMIAKNFFAYKYDYRLEWLRFIATVSRTPTGPGASDSAAALNNRVIQAVCAVVDSPAGVLFVVDDEASALAPVAEWQTRNLDPEALALDSPMVTFLADHQRIIDFDEIRAGKGDYGDFPLPGWIAVNPRIWLAVPLTHLDTMVGVLIVERSLVPRSLNWEDFDLLRTLGRQAASYIAESSTQMALDAAAKFEEFNRRFAFIMHDIKNLVSQLSLVARNAERHAENPEFRADMVKTLQSSVGKMNDMLARLSQRPGSRGSPDWKPVAVAALVEQVVAIKHEAHASLTLAIAKDESIRNRRIIGDPVQIEQLFLHLVQNAIDASAPGAPIRVAIDTHDEAGKERVIFRIEDHGSGMSPLFVRNELFEPFRSTKPNGFGIGAYEAREIARSHGGRLEVASREGEGTVFTVTLPLAATQQLADTAVTAP
ncbi:MAG: XrtA/PEP-CTERM system histidine kinase PrsK [Polymorphobacter sp.]